MTTEARRGATQHKSAYVIEKGLKQSLESTDKGLKQFLASMQKSGMVEGIAGYRALQTVLVQQRLWAHGHGRSQLQPLFRSIAKTAGELHRIFSGYADAMRALKDLDKITNTSPAPEEAPPETPPEPAPAAPAEEP
ncbi:MAG: hypothetical protein QM820_63105 [Minicystis sp.]